MAGSTIMVAQFVVKFIQAASTSGAGSSGFPSPSVSTFGSPKLILVVPLIILPSPGEDL